MAARLPAAFAEAGGTALVSSHVLAEVAQTVDRVVILDRGRLVASVALAELGRPQLEDVYLELTGRMTALIRAELLKQRSIPTGRGLLGGMLALVVFAVLLHGLSLPPRERGRP